MKAFSKNIVNEMDATKDQATKKIVLAICMFGE
jgi:hypothetical protein